MSRKLFAFLLVVCMSTAVSAAARPAATDVSGTWAGTIRIPDPSLGGRRTPFFATLKQNGEELTGTVGPAADSRVPIAKGRVEMTKFGTVVTFTMNVPGAVMNFELRPDGPYLRGLARLE